MNIIQIDDFAGRDTRDFEKNFEIKNIGRISIRRKKQIIHYAQQKYRFILVRFTHKSVFVYHDYEDNHKIAEIRKYLEFLLLNCLKNN